MNFRDLSDKKAIEKAIGEFDSIGRKEFLSKYRFGKARSYFLLKSGKMYDSKAIVGAAYGYQFGTPLTPYHFGGGDRTVRPLLESLGYRVVTGGMAPNRFMVPDEIDPNLWEGDRKTITVNGYERNAEARFKCIEYHGAICTICGLDFGKAYGPEFDGFIHVHHVVPISNIGSKYKVDPKKDLLPVCPNCHAAIHYGGKTRSVDVIKKALSKALSKRRRLT